MRNARTVFVALALCLGGVSKLEAQTPPWVFGFGTGFNLMTTEGTQGVNTSLFGPVEADFDLDPGEVMDLVKTAFGFATFATNGTWMFRFSLANIELGDDGASTLPNGDPFTADLRFETLGGDLSVGYTVYRSPGRKFALRPHVGARYTKQELGLDVTVTSASGTSTASTLVEESWTDFLVGTTVDISLVPRLRWSTVFDAGFGGSNGTYKVSTALAWQAWTRVSLSPNVSFMSEDFENGTKGDVDWYLWDAEAITFGLVAMFTF